MGDIDVLTAHRIRRLGGKDYMSDFAKHEASMNLLKYVAGTATIMTIARLLYPQGTELDPRSSDFGKIKIGDTRFDVTGGSGSIAVLAARMARHSTKSTSDGAIHELNSDEFGAKKASGVIGEFLKNKLSPGSALFNELFIDRENFLGEPTYPLTKQSVGGVLSDAFVPLPIANAYEVIKNPNGANALLTIIADGLGIATNTYAPPKKKEKAVGHSDNRGKGRETKH
jgi:hypothetical protein